MKARVRQRNRIRKSRLSGKIDTEAQQTKAKLASGADVRLPSIPDARINEIILRAQMGAEVVNNELSTRKTAMLLRLEKRNKAKLERKKALCEAEKIRVNVQMEAGGGKCATALELPAEERSDDEEDSLDVQTAFEEEIREEMAEVEATVVEVEASAEAEAEAAEKQKEDEEKATKLAMEKMAKEAKENAAKAEDDARCAKESAEAAEKIAKEERVRREFEERATQEAIAQREMEEALLAKQIVELKAVMEDTTNLTQYDLVKSALETLQKNALFGESAEAVEITAEIIKQADTLCLKLERLWLLKRAVANLNQKTIAEIKSFKEPVQEIIVVMRVVFLILGNSKKDLSNWKTIRTWIGKTGKDSLKRRISNFVPATGGLSAVTLQSAMLQIQTVDIHRIQDISAGAMVFYSWAHGMLGEMGI